MNRLPEVEAALAHQLAAEDAAEEAGLLAPDDRRTCHTCRAWATDEHLTSPRHLRVTFASPGYVAAFVAARRDAAGRPSRDSVESASRGEVTAPAFCPHTPPCPTAGAVDREAARVVAAIAEQGWSLLCNGVIVFEDGGELLPDGRSFGAHRGPARHLALVADEGRS